MLKFFRRIRRALLKEGKVRKYLVYALGEILLVMIGILLALQVNNWNEARKNRREELVALKSLQKEFRSNYQKFQDHIEPKKKLKVQWEDLLLKLSDKNLSPEEKPKRRLPPGTGTLNVSFGTLNSLINSGKVENLKNDSLKSLLTNWGGLLEDFQEEESFHWKLSKDHLDSSPLSPQPFFEVTDTKPQWLFHSEKQLDSMMSIAFQDPNYQNMMVEALMI